MTHSNELDSLKDILLCISKQKITLFEDATRNLIFELEMKLNSLDSDKLQKKILISQLNSISEMLIIYAFKNIEINLKEIIKCAYEKENIHKWENFIKIFKSKGIELENIYGYKSIDDLRVVNNAIKHNGIINRRVSKIEEFKDDYNSLFKEFEYDSLMNFYEQTKQIIPEFLSNLIQSIEE